MTNPTYVDNYGSAEVYLQGGRYPDDRPLEYETRLQRRSDDQIAVKLFDTDVVTYHADGAVELNNGGWETVTTKKRLNDYTPPHIGVYQSDREWFLRVGSYHSVQRIYDYQNHVTIRPDGTVLDAGGHELEPVEVHDRRPDYLKEQEA